MGKNRLEAFSDGVIAIIITIMVLELRPPHEPTLEALRPLASVFLSYVLSFIYLGIYWNNHHHLLHVVRTVSGPIMWANLHLLFWLSRLPFATGWMGENHVAPLPTAFYGAVLLLAALAYVILQKLIIADLGRDSKLARSIGGDFKGWLSFTCYVLAIPAAFWNPWVATAIFGMVAAIWFIPDRRIERALET